MLSIIYFIYALTQLLESSGVERESLLCGRPSLAIEISLWPAFWLLTTFWTSLSRLMHKLSNQKGCKKFNILMKVGENYVWILERLSAHKANSRLTGFVSFSFQMFRNVAWHIVSKMQRGRFQLTGELCYFRCSAPLFARQTLLMLTKYEFFNF